MICFIFILNFIINLILYCILSDYIDHFNPYDDDDFGSIIEGLYWYSLFPICFGFIVPFIWLFGYIPMFILILIYKNSKKQ